MKSSAKPYFEFLFTTTTTKLLLLNLVVSIPMCLQTILGSMGSQTQLFSGFFYLVLGDMFRPGLGHHQAFSKNTDHLTVIS